MTTKDERPFEDRPEPDPGTDRPGFFRDLRKASRLVPEEKKKDSPSPPGRGKRRT